MLCILIFFELDTAVHIRKEHETKMNLSCIKFTSLYLLVSYVATDKFGKFPSCLNI